MAAARTKAVATTPVTSEGMGAMNDKIQEYTKAFAQFGNTEAFEKAMGQFGGRLEQLTQLGTATVEAYADSSKVLVKGVEDINAAMIAFVKARLQQNADLAKALMSAKTLQDVVEIETKFAKDAYEALVSESSKLSNHAMKVANDAAQPLQARANQTMQNMMKVAA